MIPYQTIEELLSVAHVSALVASAGSTPNPIANDFGVDMEVRRVGNFDGKRIDLGVAIDLQLKATINWVDSEKHVIYDLSADAYNRIIIRNENSLTPCLLVLCCLPKEKDRWVDASEEQLILRRCCYFHEINGAVSSNTSSVRLRIPKSQLLTPIAVESLVNAQFGGTSK